MPLRVLLFGPYAGALARDHAMVPVPAHPTAAAVLRALAETHPELRSRLDGARLAVNGRLAQSDQLINPTDELAVIGMVGGG